MSRIVLDYDIEKYDKKLIYNSEENILRGTILLEQ